MAGYVYILTNDARTLYVGCTVDLFRRVEEHKRRVVKSFTSRYGLEKLVYYEVLESILLARERERQIKGWLRSKKVALIELTNPGWFDLLPNLLNAESRGSETHFS